jgi:DNA-binding NtrC family response regulator
MDHETIALPILIVSCRPENRKMLLRVFEDLPIDSYSASSVRQAKKTLRSRSFSVVFCEERLSDNAYVDLLKELKNIFRDGYRSCFPLVQPT